MIRRVDRARTIAPKTRMSLYLAQGLTDKITYIIFFRLRSCSNYPGGSGDHRKRTNALARCNCTCPT